LSNRDAGEEEDGTMSFRLISAFVALGLGVSVTPAIGQEAPDLSGKWAGAFTVYPRAILTP
jgi:hypothetical protein